MIFLRSLSDSKSLQVTRTLHCILTDLDNAVVWIVLILLLTFNSTRLFSEPSETVPNALITNGIAVIFMFDCIFSFLAKSKYLSIFLFSSFFTLLSAETVKSTRQQVLFLLINTRLGLVN